MQQSNKHSIPFQIITAVLILALLTPSFAKLHHVFENHKHEVCLDYTKTHMHEFDVDCEFYKFKLNKQFNAEFQNFELVSGFDNFKISTSQYNSVNKYQRLQFSLRGPPVLV